MTTVWDALGRALSPVTYSRCRKVLAADATAAMQQKFEGGYRDLLEDLGIGCFADLQRRGEHVKALLPVLWEMAEAIIAASPRSRTKPTMSLTLPTPDGDVRPATVADLAPVADIWYEAAVEHEQDPPPRRGVPSLYLHEFDTRELFVMERNGQVVAFAALVNRERIGFLADLFVTKAHRSTGLGQRLLRRVLPRDGRTCCTVSSNDPRALPLYVRSGMRPRWPHVYLRADLAQLRALPSADAEVIEASADDPELVRWDGEISGRHRPEDHAYWARRRGGVALWFARGGKHVGYGIVQTWSDDLLRYPDTVTIGPIGTRAREDAIACVQAAVRWVRERAKIARLSVTGPHPALAPLLSVGFRITAVETFCSNADTPFIDAQRYISSGGDLF